MPRQISFAWTTPAFLARRKTCTRRDWAPKYAAHFRKGDIITATDRVSFLGGKPIGTARLTHDVLFEPTNLIPDTDWEAEGFDYLETISATINGLTPRELWHQWRNSTTPLAVIRFEILTAAEVPAAP